MLRFVAKAFRPKSEAAAEAGTLTRCNSGAAAIEYCLIAGLIALVIIAGLSLVGNALNSKLETVASSVQ